MIDFFKKMMERVLDLERTACVTKRDGEWFAALGGQHICQFPTIRMVRRKRPRLLQVRAELCGIYGYVGLYAEFTLD